MPVLDHSESNITAGSLTPAIARPYNKERDDVPLRRQPEVFREIFEGAEFPGRCIRNLLASLAAIEIDAYFLEPEKYKDPQAQREARSARMSARHYLFSGRNKDWPFSFDSICQMIGIDPTRIRARIESMTVEEYKAIKKIKSSRRFEDD